MFIPLPLRAVLPILLLGLTVGAAPAAAQFGGLRKAAARAAESLPNPAKLLEGKPPITTGLEDARFAVDSLDNFTPARLDPKLLQIGLRGVGVRTFRGIAVDSLDNFRRAGSAVAVDSLDPFPVQSLETLERTTNGGFVLRPGYFQMRTQSYCLHAGTHGPGGGDGYLFAPPEGKAEEAIVMILRNSVAHPEIPQSQIQQLLWAIIARTKFEDLRPDLKLVAGRLLTPREMATLNRSALDLLPGNALTRAVEKMPPLVRQVFEAEADLRRLLTSAEGTFEQMEAVAVLAGMAPIGPGSRDVPSGRWSRHPDGYYVRYLPSGYSYTVTEIWVPEGSPAVGREYDPATHIAVPGNTARQRLIQSGRSHPAES